MTEKRRTRIETKTGKQIVKKNKKKNRRMTRSQNIENYVCRYYDELFEQQIHPKEYKTNTRVRKTTVIRTWNPALAIV